MRIAVVGAGGLGSKIGARLSEGGSEVTLVHRNRDYVARVNSHGIVYADQGDRRLISVRAVHENDVATKDAVDVVLVTVKSYDTQNAFRVIESLATSQSLIVTLQNGLGNRDRLADKFGTEHVGIAVSFQGATMIEPGVVEDKGSGPTYFGPDPGGLGRMDQLLHAFQSSGLESSISDSIDGIVWAKLAVTAAINGLATLLRLSNGALYDLPDARVLARQAIQETMAVAHARGTKLAFDPVERFSQVAKATQSMFSGTLLDAVRGRRTESDAIHGEIVRHARDAGVVVPLVSVIHRAIRAIEEGREHSFHQFR